jgi:hypothetical protein
MLKPKASSLSTREKLNMKKPPRVPSFQLTEEQKMEKLRQERIEKTKKQLAPKSMGPAKPTTGVAASKEPFKKGGAKKCTTCGKMKYAKGGGTRLAAAGIPFAVGAGQTDGKIATMKKGGMVKNAKLAALAAPKNKITRADIIVGAKKRARK